MWPIFHKFGSPPWLYAISGAILRWMLPVTLILLIIGAVWGLMFSPADFRQGNSYRIMYIHVPAAVVALAGYYVMALAGAINLIWRMKNGRCCYEGGRAGWCSLHLPRAF